MVGYLTRSPGSNHTDITPAVATQTLSRSRSMSLVARVEMRLLLLGTAAFGEGMRKVNLREDTAKVTLPVRESYTESRSQS